MSRSPNYRALLIPLFIAIVSLVFNDRGSFISPLNTWIRSNHGPFLASPRETSQSIWSQLPRYFPGISTKEQSQDGDWNILYHLGGNGPWIAKLDGVDSSKTSGPELDRCVIDQVHMMSRHGARYPTKSAGGRHLALLNRIQEANLKLNCTLSFLNNWTYFTDDPPTDIDQLTTTGPYAGTAQSFETGVDFAARYSSLMENQTRVKLWASDCNRVIQTARRFASGMFGSPPDSSAAESGIAVTLEVIPETADRGADTLTPGDTCLRYLEDTDHGHDYGIRMLARYQQVYIPAIAERLITEQGNEALKPLTNSEVYSMQEMCGFETLVRGSSPWCEVFTRDDWEHFEYARDVLHYYRAGPGNPYAGAMGWLWLNATTGLLRAGPRAGTLFFSFVHDGDIAPFLTALEIMGDPTYDPELPVTHIARDRAWRASSVMPMGGRVVLERMTCPSSAGGAHGEEMKSFVRVVINDKVTPLSYCHSGPGLSCPLVDFVGHVERRRLEVGEFGAVCGLDGDPGRITFLRQD